MRWTCNNSYLISIGGRDVATLVWRHDRNTEVEIIPSSISAPTPPLPPTAQTKTTVRNVRATPTNTTTAPLTLRRERGESDDSDNTDSEEEGYDSDVQHDRSMDYNARILIDPIRTKHEKKDITPSTANRKHM